MHPARTDDDRARCACERCLEELGAAALTHARYVASAHTTDSFYSARADDLTSVALEAFAVSVAGWTPQVPWVASFRRRAHFCILDYLRGERRKPCFPTETDREPDGGPSVAELVILREAMLEDPETVRLVLDGAAEAHQYGGRELPRPNATRARILRAARTLGGSPSHLDLARAAGVNKVTVYRHFPTPAHLAEAL